MSRDSGGGGLVYSTEQGGRVCPDCGRAGSACKCPPQRKQGNAPAKPANTPPRDGVVRVGRETKGRKGAGVTVVMGAPLDSAGLAALCTKLKKRCGAGGAVKGDVVEIQGDHRDAVVEELTREGWTVKRVGG